MLSPESSVAFQIGGFSVKFYSITMFLAIISGISLMVFVAKKHFKNISVDALTDMLPIVIIGALLGARLYYIFLNFNFYLRNPIEIIAVHHGGISIHGAILGGFICGYLYIKKHKLNLLQYADIFPYGLLLGQIIGRLGNYFNIEAFGKPCTFSDLICMYVPLEKRPLAYLDYAGFHPTFLYEMIWNVLLLVLLLISTKKLKQKSNGTIFCLYLILYSIGRLFIEQIRLDSTFNFGPIHIAQIASIVLILTATITLAFINKTKKQ